MGEAKVSAIVEYTQLLASPSDWEGAEQKSFRIMAPLDLLRDWTGMDNELSYVRFQTNDEGEKLFNPSRKNFLIQMYLYNQLSRMIYKVMTLGDFIHFFT